jgi:hypothetical protein
MTSHALFFWHSVASSSVYLNFMQVELQWKFRQTGSRYSTDLKAGENVQLMSKSHTKYPIIWTSRSRGKCDNKILWTNGRTRWLQYVMLQHHHKFYLLLFEIPENCTRFTLFHRIENWNGDVSKREQQCIIRLHNDHT